MDEDVHAVWGNRFVSRPEARRAITVLRRLVADEAEAEGDLPLKSNGVYAAELSFHLGEEESALEILNDADKSSTPSSLTKPGEPASVLRRANPRPSFEITPPRNA